VPPTENPTDNTPKDENPPVGGNNGGKGNKGNRKGGFFGKVWGKVEKILIGDIVDDNI
jgi:hypothetical protein